MFGLGLQELIVILVVFLLFVGPRRLPDVARTLGKGMRELRRASRDLEDVEEIRDLRDALDEVRRPVEDALREVRHEIVTAGEPAPPQGPAEGAGVRSPEPPAAAGTAPGGPAAAPSAPGREPPGGGGDQGAVS